MTDKNVLAFKDKLTAEKFLKEIIEPLEIVYQLTKRG
jgi:hypothetical protein